MFTSLEKIMKNIETYSVEERKEIREIFLAWRSVFEKMAGEQEDLFDVAIEENEFDISALMKNYAGEDNELCDRYTEIITKIDELDGKMTEEDIENNPWMKKLNLQ